MTFRDTEELRCAESRTLNVDHATAGAWLVKAWAFPLTFAEVAGHHHDKFNHNDRDLLALVKTGCLLTNALGYSPVRYAQCPTYKEVQKSISLHAPGRVLPALRDSVETKLRAFA
jgi:HD-like signal output (HDOD) protein